ncbi:growth hormone-releasing hormone receptor-like [Cetorhinus maximus]
MDLGQRWALGKLHPECEILTEIKRDKEQCLQSIKENGNASVQGRAETEERHNQSQASARAVIERTIGLFKMRFCRLDRSGGALQYPLKRVSLIVIVCCALHNLALARGGRLEDDDSEAARQAAEDESTDEEPEEAQGEDVAAEVMNLVGGRETREALILRSFHSVSKAWHESEGKGDAPLLNIPDEAVLSPSGQGTLQAIDFLICSTGTITRNCTSKGWSNPLPADLTACVTDAPILTAEVSYYGIIQIIYTVGYSLSLVILSGAVVILSIIRRLHCTRNYIHIQLFITFILRSLSVFIKDAVLFGDADVDHCTFSTVGCKISVVFCYFCMMTNYFWLLVEALYLNCLLIVSFSNGKSYFWWWSILGWGVPIVCTIVWVITKLLFENSECWDVIEDSPYWWIIKGPIVVSVAVNFVLFINIIRILVQKLIPNEIHKANFTQYRRLTKSTLLLVPLFGVHYIVCAFPPDGAVLATRLYLDLCIGSFQGFIVGVLYCFLNQEVQTEIHRRWLRKRLNSYGAVPVMGKSQMDTCC